MRLLIAALLCSGCALPSAAREPTERERQVVNTYRQVFEESRGDIECSQVDRLDIVPVSLEEVRLACHNDKAIACVYTINATAFHPLSTLVYVQADLPQDVFEYALMHEIGHELRGCWVSEEDQDYDEFIRRLRYPAWGCRVSYPKDPGHCDSELYNGYATEAARRIE